MNLLRIIAALAAIAFTTPAVAQIRAHHIGTDAVEARHIKDGTISAADVADNTDTVNLPLAGWIDATALLPLDASGADAEPDFVAVNSAIAIAYDVTGGSVDTNEIGTSFVVPDTYASGGRMCASVTQGGATVTNIEDFDCRWSINGAAIGAVGTVALVNQTAQQVVCNTPAGTLAARASVGVNCKQSDASGDDTVNVLAVWFEFVADQ